MADPARWVVAKFGGTSVSSVANWQNIASVVRARLAEGVRPVVVHSALSGVTDRLEECLRLATNGGAAIREPSSAPVLAASLESTSGPRSGSTAEAGLESAPERRSESIPAYDSILAEIVARHRALAADLQIEPGPAFEELLANLRQMLAGIALVGEVGDRVRARFLANGELLATQLGAQYLASLGLDVGWIDARTVLTAEASKHGRNRTSYLSATCDFAPDAALEHRFAAAGQVIVTQGFIAGDGAGHTVLLGRGGSDTSASYLAAKLGAERLEIWTDVPGMFSADPRAVPAARLLRALEYDEAQEIASNGAKVLHPRCLAPVRRAGIPLHVFATQSPALQGTVIGAGGRDGGAQVKAVCIKKGITLVSMETLGMWHQVGFLADAFAVFKEHGLSIDQVSTSETNVTVSLDPSANAVDEEVVADLVADLSAICKTKVLGPCAAVSLVGRNIRAILHRLGDALQLFEEQKIYLVTQASNDLNLTFVVDEAQGDRLAKRLHEQTIRAVQGDLVLGATWEQLFGARAGAAHEAEPWWVGKRELLIELARETGSAFVYDGNTVASQARALRASSGADRVFYAVKANPHAELLRILRAEGIAFECVSQGELEHVRAALPSLEPPEILFTPNFAPRSEYAWALEHGIPVTLDNLHPLVEWPDLFAGRELHVRVDTGFGRGHHAHVRTAGTHSKFGVPVSELEELAQAARAVGATVVGLHAHTGSGIFDVENWREVGEELARHAALFPDVRSLDLGGGLGVPERPGQPPLDLAALRAVLEDLRARYPRFELWLEPGRYLVAQAGVLVAEVTQLKGKGRARYVGIATGMNSLIRPALYGAHHEIANLTRYGEPATDLVDIVGPICESADQLGSDRLLPPTHEGDVLLIANTGAYGRAMSSHYNLRPPAPEVVLTVQHD